MKITLIIPCYNERDRLNIGAIIDLSQVPELELLFVDDGSIDNTRELLNEIVAKSSQAHLIANKENCGKASSIQTGVLWLKERNYTGVISFLDADFATDPYEAIKIIRGNMSRETSHIFLFGSRVRVVGKSVKRKLIRLVCGRLFSWIVNFMTKLPIYDFQCGFKAFSSDLAYKLFEESFKTRWFFDTELFLRSRVVEGISFIEVPLDVWVDRDGSKLKPIDFVMTLPNLFLIYKHYRKLTKTSVQKSYKYTFIE